MSRQVALGEISSLIEMLDLWEHDFLETFQIIPENWPMEHKRSDVIELTDEQDYYITKLQEIIDMSEKQGGNVSVIQAVIRETIHCYLVSTHEIVAVIDLFHDALKFREERKNER